MPTCWDCGRDHGGPRCGAAWSLHPVTNASISPSPPPSSHFQGVTCWDCGRVHGGQRCGGAWSPTRQPLSSPPPLLHSADSSLSSMSSDQKYAKDLQARLLQEERDAQLAHQLQLDEPSPVFSPAHVSVPAAAAAPALAECIICCDAARDCVLVPCGHLSTCRACALQLVQCSVCRADIQQRLPVYM